MKPTSQDATTEDLIEALIRDAIAQDQATILGDVPTFNRLAREIRKAKRILFGRSGEEHRKLVPLLGHFVPRVRLIAASFLLRLGDRQALAVLERIVSDGAPQLAIGAHMLLKLWRQGKLPAI